MSIKMTQKLLTLNNGAKMPAFGLGTWKGTPEEAFDAVYCAIKNNYRLIDCAAVYLNEGGVGKAIKKCIDEKIVERKDLFVVTKLWNTCHSVEHVESSIKNSLSLLGLDYIDLYLVHFPMGFEYNGVVGEGSDESSLFAKDPQTGWPKLAKNAPLYKLWGAMETMVEKGYTKSIGVSNYTIPLIADMMSYAKIMPSVNQIELHPYMPRKDLSKFCNTLGIKVMAYSPLGSSSTKMLEEKVVKELANKYKSTPAQVLLCWSLQMGNIVIPKSVNSERIKSNINWCFELSESDMEKLGTLDKTYVPFCDTSEFWNFVNVNTF